MIAGGGSGDGGTVVVPNIQATATTLSAGSEATVTRSGSDTNPVFAFGIPQGIQGNQGPMGAQGVAGPTGATGPAGPGVPTGGTTGQVLAKASDTDYDTQWVPSSGGGTGYQQGNGISIQGDTISVRLSQTAGNGLVIGPDGGLWGPEGGGGGAVQLQSIAITTPPNTTEYTAGQTFDNTGMVVTAYYNLGLSEVVTGYTISPSGVLTGDITEIVVSYSAGGVLKTATQSITVNRIAGTITLNPYYVELNADENTATVQVSYNGNGTLAAESGNSGLVSANLGGNALQITSLAETPEIVMVTVSSEQTDLYTSASATLTVSNYTTSHVFGVAWDMSNPATQLVRLTPETDPYNIVTNTISAEPQPATGSGEGSSPFDGFLPWNGMQKYNVINNSVSYNQNNPEFSQTSYDTVVYIPPTFYRRELSGNIQYFYVGDNMFSGAELHPGSGRYVARYMNDTNQDTKSGTNATLGASRATARESCHNKGANWWLLDVASLSAVWLLYIVEFADWNARDTLGDGPSNVANGQTDSMIYHTGKSDDGAIQYRNIENFGVNYYNWVDGAIFVSGQMYVSTQPSLYNDTDVSQFQICGTSLPATGYIKSLQLQEQNKFVFLPSATGGSSSTYIPYYMNSGGGTTAFSFGAPSGYYAYGGLFSMNTLYNQSGGIIASSTAYRMMFLAGGD